MLLVVLKFLSKFSIYFLPKEAYSDLGLRTDLHWNCQAVLSNQNKASILSMKFSNDATYKILSKNVQVIKNREK
jgi:hypothetical protein